MCHGVVSCCVCAIMSLSIDGGSSSSSSCGDEGSGCGAGEMWGRSLLRPGAARQGPKRFGATGCCTFYPRSWFLGLGSRFLGLLDPFSGLTPETRKPETTTQTKVLCLPRLPTRRAHWLFGGLSLSLWSGGRSLSFPWSGSKATFLGSCVTNSPYSFSLDPERTHKTQHAVPYLLYTHAGRHDLTIDVG